MRDKLDNPLPETTQAPPASSIFDPRYWLPLTRAFGQFMSIIEARDHALICINRDVHEGQLRLLLVAPDGTTMGARRLGTPKTDRPRAAQFRRGRSD